MRSNIFDTPWIGFRRLTLFSGTYLETLEKSAGALEMSLPYLGQPVKLNNGQPGL